MPRRCSDARTSGQVEPVRPQPGIPLRIAPRLLRIARTARVGIGIHCKADANLRHSAGRRWGFGLWLRYSDRVSKSILYRWCGLRKVPKDTRTRLMNEGIIFDEEGTSSALSYRKFRGPRNYSGRGREGGAVGSLVITERTLYVRFPYQIICDHPIQDAVRHLELDLKGPAELAMTFGVEELFERATGQLTCYWRVENATEILDHILKLQAGRDPGATDS